eukprot:GHVN01055548.1.p1 GENE.GHVN01055548.1~~GHVN01055548.1.p1  ORF type:complete len:402 (+),score=52.66 GHVN01055548.1:84-1289(+)
MGDSPAQDGSEPKNAASHDDVVMGDSPAQDESEPKNEASIDDVVGKADRSRSGSRCKSQSFGEHRDDDGRRSRSVDRGSPRGSHHGSQRDSASPPSGSRGGMTPNNERGSPHGDDRRSLSRSLSQDQTKDGATGKRPLDTSSNRSRSGSQPKDRPRKRGREDGSRGDREKSPSQNNPEESNIETIKISDEDASFILGAGGRTKRKLSRVSGADLSVTGKSGETILEIRGNKETRERTKLYVGFVMQQRVGPVKLEFEPDSRDDLTCIKVPHECVGYVTGRKGQGLRSIEEEWCTLMFFTDLRSERVGESERLAIFGIDERARRGAELKVMSAVEQKLPGHFTSEIENFQSEEEGFGSDYFKIDTQDYSYALGKEGMTRKKLARASGAILEYVGKVAFMAGR